MEATIDGAGRVVIPKRLRDEFGIAPGAWFETFSVLTRLPGPARRDASTVVRLLSANVPCSRFLDEASTAALAGELSARGVSGGAVHDALVAAAAAHHRLPLVSRGPS